MHFRYGVLEVGVEGTKDSESLVDFVAAHLGKISRPSLSLDALSLIELGSVYVNAERVLNPNLILRPGEPVRIHAEPRRFLKPANLRSRITEEDDNYVYALKPAGLPCGPTVDNLQENLVSYLSEERHQFLYLTHSIDIESEGLIVLAKSIAAQEAAQRSFAENSVTRTLVAFVERPLEVMVYNASIRVLTCEQRSAETALITEGPFAWAILGEPLKSYSRLEIELKNGRPSEVRDLLAALNSPILGDRTHGSARTLTNPATGKATPALVSVRFRF